MPRFDIPDDLKKEALNNSLKKENKNSKRNFSSNEEKKSKNPFKNTRAGKVLTKSEVKAIKAGRKKVKKELRAKGIKSNEDFELTCTSLGLYFDSNNSALLFFLRSHWLGTLLASLLLLIGVLFIFSTVQQMRGLFTINMTESMFRSGFELSESLEFLYPSSQLFATVAELKDCESIQNIPADLDETDGSHNSERYFAYTFYIKNSGESSMSYKYSLNISSEANNASSAIWYILYFNGIPKIYAKAKTNTNSYEVLTRNVDGVDTIVSYPSLPLQEANPNSQQFEAHNRVDGRGVAYRVIPYQFESDKIVTSETVDELKPEETDKYTIVMWLEGDDPEATDELIGSHIGSEIQFSAVGEDDDEIGMNNEADEEGIFASINKMFKNIFAAIRSLFN